MRRATAEVSPWLFCMPRGSHVNAAEGGVRAVVAQRLGALYKRDRGRVAVGAGLVDAVCSKEGAPGVTVALVEGSRIERLEFDEG